jgi:hypothetical protein
LTGSLLGLPWAEVWASTLDAPTVPAGESELARRANILRSRAASAQARPGAASIVG